MPCPTILMPNLHFDLKLAGDVPSLGLLPCIFCSNTAWYPAIRKQVLRHLLKVYHTKVIVAMRLRLVKTYQQYEQEMECFLSRTLA